MLNIIPIKKENYHILKLSPSSYLMHFPEFLKTPEKDGLILSSMSDCYKIIDILKKVNCPLWLFNNKRCSFEEIVTNIKNLYYGNEEAFNDFYFSFSDILNSNIIEDAISYIKENSKEHYDIILKILDDSDLKEFQKVSLIYYIYKIVKYGRKKILIGDERGLGKTITSIKAVYYLNLFPCLVICPAYLRINWSNEINKWVGNNHFVIQNSKDLLVYPKKKFIIISYELFANDNTLKKFMNRNFKSIILDEIQYIKNTTAKRTKNISKLLDKTEYVIGLSGTPLWNKPQDGYKIFNTFDSFMFKYKTHYENRYCQFEKKTFRGRTVRVITGAKDTKDLGEKIRKLFMIRRTKAQVMSQLGTKNRIKVYCELDYSIKVMSDDILEFIEQMSFKKGREYLELKEKILEFQQNIAMVKIPLVVNMIKDIVYDGESVVVFFYHRIVGQTLHQVLNNEKIPNVLFIGGLNDKVRKELLDKFNSDKCNVFLGSIRACGMGLNLTKANNVIFLQYETSPNWNLQAEDRCHRIGQDKPVNIYYITMKDTIDEMMIDTLMTKSEYIDQIMMDNRESKIEFSSEDLIQELIKKFKREDKDE